MNFTNHIKERMQQRRVSPYMIDVIVEMGDFNNNSERLILDKRHKNLITSRLNEIVDDASRSCSLIREVKKEIKEINNIEEQTDTLSKYREKLIEMRRGLKKNARRSLRKTKDLERMMKKRFTLVLSSENYITVF